MRSIGFDNKLSAYNTQDFALSKQYPCRISVKKHDKGEIYFVWVDKMTIEQSEEVNEFARTQDGLIWLSTLREDYKAANRAWDELYD